MDFGLGDKSVLVLASSSGLGKGVALLQEAVMAEAPREA